MQKKLYFLDEEEKNRILNLHENRTKKQYIVNESTLFDPTLDTLGMVTLGPAYLPIKSLNLLWSGIKSLFPGKVNPETLKDIKDSGGNVGNELQKMVTDEQSALKLLENLMKQTSGNLVELFKIFPKTYPIIYDKLPKTTKETIDTWSKIPCVTNSKEVKPVFLPDKTITFDGGGFYWYGGNRKMDKKTRVKSDYFCRPDGRLPIDDLSNVKSWKLLDPEYGKELKKAMGKNPDEDFSDEDITDIYDKLVDLKVINV